MPDALPDCGALFERGEAARRANDRLAALAWFEQAVAADPRDIRARLALAGELRETGQIDVAETIYHALLAEHPTQMHALLGLGQCLSRRGDRIGAMERFRAAAQGSPNEIWPRLALATELRELGRFAEAEAIYREVVAAQPTEMHALLGLGVCARRRGDRVEAVARFGAAAEAHPREVWPRIELAAELRELGRFTEAEPHYQAVLAEQPTQLYALLGLGVCARRRGDPAEAMARFIAAAAAHPREVWPRIELAAEQRDRGEIEAAEETCRTVLADHPAQLHALLGLGQCARRRGDRAEALARFRAAAEAHPAEILPRIELAAELRELGRFTEAAALYRAVLAEQPTQLYALLGLGVCARRDGDRATALAQFQAAAEAHPRDIWPRIEIAAELHELGRIDEAEASYRAMLAEQPSQIQALLGLGHCARRRGDRVAALARFQEAAEAHPRDIWPRLEIAAELRDRGDFAAAVATCEAVLADNPAELQAWLSIGHTHHRAGRLESAFDAFQRAGEHWPGLPTPCINAARIQRLLGRHEASRKMLHDLLERAPENAEALQELGEQARLGQKPEEAEALFRRALASQPSSTQAAFGLSQALAELGRADEALQLLAALAEQRDTPAEISAKQIQILRQIGRWDQALALVRHASAAAPWHFWLWCHRVEMEMLTAHYAAAEEALCHPPAGNTHEMASVFHLRGQLAELQWQFDAAIGYYREAQALNPQNGGVCNTLARVLLLSLDVDGAREQLQQLMRMEMPVASLQGRSSNVSQTLLGQILDEYALDAETLAAMAECCKLPPAERIQPLLGLVRRLPDYTPAAITWLIALRQANRLPAAAVAESAGNPVPVPRGPIPRLIVQFWDQPEPPADLCRLMQSWRDANPGFDYRLFDDQAAQEFLRLYTPAVLQAYRRASEPAQKADIFRLAWLFAHGGYYADADDCCLESIATVIPAHVTLALYQEDVCTIGNNFIGAVPQHSVIGRALELAVEAVNRGDRDLLWFSTGPGLLTRAFVQVIAESSLNYSVWLENIVVLGRNQLYRAATLHCLTAYKHTTRHWNKSIFGKSR